MLPLGIMVGLAVRMGHVIANDPHRAKLLAAWCMGLIVVLGSMVTLLLYRYRLGIILLFTNDDQVILQALHIWPNVCAYVFLIYIYGISSAIYRGLGMQWRLAWITTVMLYVFLLPMVVYFAIIKHGGLYMQWQLMPSFYTIFQIVLACGYLVVDWEEVGGTVREGLRKLEQEKKWATEESPLLVK
jgi:Na+-driven multidrug efflux pump